MYFLYHPNKKYWTNLHPDSLYFSAEIYNKQNNIEKAKIYCDKILNEYPNTRQWIIDKAKQCFDLNETNT